MDKTAKTYAMTLPEMITERDRLNAAIETEQIRRRADWNSRVDDLERHLSLTLGHSGVPYEVTNRKNITTIKITGTHVIVEFPYLVNDNWSVDHVVILVGGDIPQRSGRVRVEVDPLNVTAAEFMGLLGVFVNV